MCHLRIPNRKCLNNPILHTIKPFFVGSKDGGSTNSNWHKCIGKEAIENANQQCIFSSSNFQLTSEMVAQPTSKLRTQIVIASHNMRREKKISSRLEKAWPFHLGSGASRHWTHMASQQSAATGWRILIGNFPCHFLKPSSSHKPS